MSRTVLPLVIAGLVIIGACQVGSTGPSEPLVRPRTEGQVEVPTYDIQLQTEQPSEALPQKAVFIKTSN